MLVKLKKFVLFAAGLAQCAFGLAAQAQSPADHASFQAAQALQREDKEREAILACLDIPGGEHAAVTLARPQPKVFLELLQRGNRPSLSPRASLFEADLLLASGRKKEARRLYHTLAAEGPAENWSAERADYPPVEPQRPKGRSSPKPTLKPGLCGGKSGDDAWHFPLNA